MKTNNKITLPNMINTNQTRYIPHPSFGTVAGGVAMIILIISTKVGVGVLTGLLISISTGIFTAYKLVYDD